MSEMLNRSELRTWLKRAIALGLLARLPPEFDPDGSGSEKTADYARRLLDSLVDPARSHRSVADTLNEGWAFRRWADERLRVNRRRLLAEAEFEPIDMDRLAPPRPAPPPIEKPPPVPPHLRVPREPNPLWDRWLDG